MSTHPMPAVVEKGEFPLFLDLRYSTVDARKEGLKALRIDPDFIRVAQARGAMTPALAQHFEHDWFGPNNWFVTIRPDGTMGPLDAHTAKTARPLVSHALIEALETSLGLADGEQIPSGAPRKDRPLQVFWVCGKMDGFDCQVAWHDFDLYEAAGGGKGAPNGGPDGVVSLFLVTPPINNSAHDLAIYLPSAQRQAAKQNEPRGMILMRVKRTAKRMWFIRKNLVHLDDGGVTR